MFSGLSLILKTMEIKLTQDKSTKIDDEDFNRVSHLKWFAHFDGYNWYAIAKLPGNISVSLHRFIMNAKPGQRVDHEDRNGLNNLRNNLRFSTHAQNMRNIGIKSVNKSGFKGVGWKARNKKWCAQIAVNWKVIHLGLFDDKKEAAKCYDKAAEKFHGEFALTNKKLGLL